MYWRALPLLTMLVDPASALAATTLAPTHECHWIFFGRADNPSASCPSVDTRQGSRSALTFDLSGIDADQVVSLTLELVPVQSVENGGVFIADIEAIPLSSSDGTSYAPVDPFVYTLENPETGPCSPSSASCVVFAVEDPTSGDGVFSFARSNADGFPRFPLDVSDAIAALQVSPFLQLSLVPSGPATLTSGVQLGHSGFADPRLAPATLTVEVVPEPSTGLLLTVGLIGLATQGRPRRHRSG